MSQEAAGNTAPQQETGELYTMPYHAGGTPEFYAENLRAIVMQAVERCLEGTPKEGMIKFKRSEDPWQNGAYKIEFSKSKE